MDGHLTTLAVVLLIAVALVHELVQCEAPVHQDACWRGVGVGGREQ